MMILQKNNLRLVNAINLRMNPDSTLGIYLASAKLAQCILVADNRIEKEEAKKETAKKKFTPNLHLQQKRCEDFQKCQYPMNSLSLSPTK